MAGGHGGEFTFNGVTLQKPKPKRWHTVTGKGLCAVKCFVYFQSSLLNCSLSIFLSFLFPQISLIYSRNRIEFVPGNGVAGCV
ncbi:hypothetical protein LINGRAHAP2_LOCUS19643 [Linum grandiflorum]